MSGSFSRVSLIVDLGLLGLSQIEIRVGDGLAHPGGDRLACLPVDLELLQGLLHPVLLPQGDDVVSPGPEIAGVFSQNHLDLRDRLVDESPSQLRHGPVELERLQLRRPAHPALFCDHEGLEACAVLLQQGHFDGIERRPRYLPALSCLQPRRVGPGTIAHAHLRVNDAFERLVVLRVVGQAETVELEGLGVFPQLVVGLGHVTGDVADLQEVLFAGSVEFHGLLVGSRPDQAQGVVGLEVPVVRKGLQGPLQQRYRLVVATVLDPFQRLLVVRLRLGHGVRLSRGFRGGGKDRRRQK